MKRDLNASKLPFKNASVGSMRTEHTLTGIRVVVDGKEYIVKEGEITNSNKTLSSYLKFIEEALVKKRELEKKIEELIHPTTPPQPPLSE